MLVLRYGDRLTDYPVGLFCIVVYDVFFVHYLATVSSSYVCGIAIVVNSICSPADIQVPKVIIVVMSIYIGNKCFGMDIGVGIV